MGGLMNKLREVYRSLTDGLRTERMERLPTPRDLRRKYPIDKAMGQQIVAQRQTIRDILDGNDPRFLAVHGPCSARDEGAMLEYGRCDRGLQKEISPKIYTVARVCVDKPRSQDGWEGKANDTHGDGRCDLAASLESCRRLLHKLVKMGIPVALEALDPSSVQYFSDLLAYDWSGARNVESTTIRRMISAMSTCFGVKNATSGDIGSAVSAMAYARSPRTFPGLDLSGRLAKIRSKGNDGTVLILRGGKYPDYMERVREDVLKALEPAHLTSAIIDNVKAALGGVYRPNYFPEDIELAVKSLKKMGLPPRVVIDTSHDNSSGDYNNQEVVFRSIVQQRAAGQSAIRGAVIESFNKGGKVKFTPNPQGFKGFDPDVSVTDACLSREKTEELLRWAARIL